MVEGTPKRAIHPERKGVRCNVSEGECFRPAGVSIHTAKEVRITLRGWKWSNKVNVDNFEAGVGDGK